MENSINLIQKAFLPILLVLFLLSCNKNETQNALPDYGMNNVFLHYSMDGQPLFRSVKAITEDDNGNIWYGGYQIIVKYDGSVWENITGEFDFEFTMIECVLKDDDNTIWFGTESGILKINCDNYEYATFTVDDGLANNSIKDIYKDSEGNYWIASYSTPGLTKFDGINWTIIDYPWEKSGWVRNVFQDNNEVIWFAAMGEGVYNFHDTTWTTYNIDAVARSIMSYNEEIIVGTTRGIQKHISGNWLNILPELDSADILCMMVDHNNILWFGNYNDYLGYGLAKYNGTTPQILKPVAL